MECNKCKFKSDDKNVMEQHLEKKHKIESAKYIIEGIKESRFITNLDDLHHYELEKLEKKLVDCEFCRKQGIKEDISSKEIEKALIIKASASEFPKTRLGHWGDGKTSPEWVCSKCEPEHAAKIKHWKLLHDVKDMISACENEHYDVESKLKKEGIFSRAEWDECGLDLTYTKKVKKKEYNLNVNVYGHKEDKHVEIHGYDNDWEKVITQDEIKTIKEEAVKFYKQYWEENSKVWKKYESELGLVQVDYDEGYMVYRNDKNKVLITVASSSDDDDDVDNIDEIKQSYSANIGNKYMFEIFKTGSGVIYEYIWTIKKSDYNRNERDELINHRHVDFDYASSEHFEVVATQKDFADNLRKLMTTEQYEATVKFANKELRFFIKHGDMGKRDSYSFQWRNELQYEPFSEAISMVSYELVQLIKCYATISKWIEEAHTKKTLVGKITKVGSNSKQIIFDKI